MEKPNRHAASSKDGSASSCTELSQAFRQSVMFLLLYFDLGELSMTTYCFRFILSGFLGFRFGAFLVWHTCIVLIADKTSFKFPSSLPSVLEVEASLTIPTKEDAEEGTCVSVEGNNWA